MAQMYQVLGRREKADKVRSDAENMRKTVYEHGWDGEWFLRAYDAESKKIGSHENEEGKIFIESQGWCIMGGLGLENGYALKALDSVKKHLATPDGIVLQQPAFSTYHLELGEITSYPPGYKENAGVFTHNNTWIQIAETIVGRGDRAFEYYLSICPPVKEDNITTYRAEPYIYSQMTAGPDAPTPGEGKNSWLTGTAAWSFVAIAQYILGIKPDYNGLMIDPCIPSSWKEYKVHRVFRGKVYDIHVRNSAGVCKGIKSVKVDGKKIEGNTIPLDLGGARVQVVVELG